MELIIGRRPARLRQLEVRPGRRALASEELREPNVIITTTTTTTTNHNNDEYHYYYH